MSDKMVACNNLSNKVNITAVTIVPLLLYILLCRFLNNHCYSAHGCKCLPQADNNIVHIRTHTKHSVASSILLDLATCCGLASVVVFWCSGHVLMFVVVTLCIELGGDPYVIYAHNKETVSVTWLKL